MAISYKHRYNYYYFFNGFCYSAFTNKDTKAIQLKLNELIAASSEASNRVVSIEDLTDEELEVIKKFYTHLANSAKKENNVFSTHSLDEAKLNAEKKYKIKNPTTKKQST